MSGRGRARDRFRGYGEIDLVEARDRRDSAAGRFHALAGSRVSVQLREVTVRFGLRGRSSSSGWR